VLGQSYLKNTNLDIVVTMNTDHKNPSSYSFKKRSADERGATDLGWLKSRHTFSFGEYYDKDFIGFESLCVINDDVVAPGEGFGMHPHKDAEIFSYVIEGSLEHKDTLGHRTTINAGEFQYMSAGSGILHSEYNPAPDKPVHFLQVWLKPNQLGGEPRYAEIRKDTVLTNNKMQHLFFGSHVQGTIPQRQSAEIYMGRLETNGKLSMLTEEKPVWIHLIRGALKVGEENLKTGDGAAVRGAHNLDFKALEPTEFLVFLL